jgi:hypothetical protein
VCTKPTFKPARAARRHGRVRIRPRVRCNGRARDVVVRVGSAYTTTGRAVTVRAPATAKRIRATFSVDGHADRAQIALH